MATRKNKTQKRTPKKTVPSAKDSFNPKSIRDPDKIVDEITGKTLLIDALLKNDMDMLGKLLKAGADPNKASKEGKTPLHYAARLGLDQAVVKLVESGAQTNPRDKSLETPLFDAVRSDNAEAVLGALLSCGGNLGIQDMYGRTALHEAARLAGDNDKDRKVLKKLIAASGNPDVPDEKGMTPFLLACQMGTQSAIETFLFERASIFSADIEGNTCLHFAAARMDNGNACRFLISGEAGGIVNAVNLQGRSPLHAAIRKGDTNLVQALHDVGANMNLPDAKGTTPLQEATISGSVRMAELLIALGADIAKTHAAAGTPLLLQAVRTDRPEMAALFLEHSADPNLQDAQGVTALMEAAFRNNNKMVELLLERGADVTVKDKLLRNVLHHMGPQVDEKTVELLVKAGAEIDGQDFWQRTPLQSAVREYNAKTALALLDLGANPNVADNQGQTPLHLAVSQRRTQLVEGLLNKKADPNVADTALKMTPLHIACNLGLQGDAALLIKAGAKVNEKDHQGRTPLHYAVQGYGYMDELGRLLLRSGGDPIIEDKHGTTPYDIAHSLNKHGIISHFKAELTKRGRKYTPKKPNIPPWGGMPF